MEEINNIVQKVMSLREASIDGWSEAIAKSDLVQDFIRHEPYTEQQKKDAIKMSKPLLRYNILVAKLLGLEGQELINRRKTIFLPRYAASDKLVRVISDHWDYLSNREELTTKLIRAMSDGLCYPTMGWLRRKIEIDDFGYLTFKWDNIDTFSIHPDPTMKMLDMSDCDFVSLDDWMTMEQINRVFKPTPFSSAEVQYAYQQVQMRRGDELKSYYSTSRLIDGDRYLVVQHEDRVYVSVDICDVNGEIRSLTTKEADDLSNQGAKVEYIKSGWGERIRCTTILPSHDVVLENTEYKFDSKRFSFFPCSSYDWVMEKRKQPSLMYILTDVQDSISKAKSQHLDFMIQQLVEDYHISAREDQAIKDLEENKGKAHRIIRYQNINNRAIRSSGSQNAGALQSIQSDIYMSLDFVSEISSITPAMEGKAGKSGESAKLFDSKVERGLTTTNPYYEIKAKANLQLAKDYLELAKDVFFEDDRVLEKNYDPKTGLNFEIVNLNFNGIVKNDVRKAKIEAVLDEGENTEARLEQTFQENLAMVQVMLNAGYPSESIPWENIIENSNLRDKHLWLEKIKEGLGIMELNAQEQLATSRINQMSVVPTAQQQLPKGD